MKFKLSTRLFLLAMFFACITTSFAQKDSLANVLGDVIDFSQNARHGETITFKDLSSQKRYSVVSDANGKFKLGLPFNRDYLIIIEGFQVEQEYAQITIPALREDQSGFTFNITIEFDPPRTFTLNNVQFESGSAKLTKSSYTELKDLVDYLLMKTEVVVEIGGHTDNVGEADENLDLSKKRAESVKTYLVKNGIKKEQVVAKGYGESDPIASNETESGRQKNRRTEVRIISD